MTDRVIAVVQARCGSQRLPGKVLLELAGIPVIDHVVRRLRRSSRVDRIIVATSTEATDDRLCHHLDKAAVDYVRGDIADVRSRFLAVAAKYPSEAMVRITGDSPLVDPEIVDSTVTLLFDERLDYATTRTPTEAFLPRGMDVEAFRTSALLMVSDRTRQRYHREHVTPAFYDGSVPGLATGVLRIGPDHSRLRLCLDTEEDLKLLERIFKVLPADDFSWQTTVSLVEANGAWRLLNRDVEQRDYKHIDHATWNRSDE